jgi:hypothetical protein
MRRFELHAPVRFAFRRMRERRVSFAALTLALAGAAALMAWSSVTAALSQEENVRLRLREVAPDARSLEAVYHLLPYQPAAEPIARLDAFVGEFDEVTEPAHRLRVWQPVEGGVHLVASRAPTSDTVVEVGRLPMGCRRNVCEALALTGDFAVGQRIELGHVVAIVVGRGSIRPEALPIGPDALAGGPDLGDRALLVRSIDAPLADLLAPRGNTIVTTAAVDPEKIEASELRTTADRMRRAIVRLERGEGLAEATGPFRLLGDIGDRGDTARRRLLLVAAQAAALILAFAAFGASARRAETRLLDDQLTALGATRPQVLATRVTEAFAPCALGALVGLAGVWIAVEAIAERRGLPESFTASALPLGTVLAVVGVAAVGTVLLLVSPGPPPRTRFGIGALELAALSALGIVVWQAATTGALDPEQIGSGTEVSPILLLVPALAFFVTGVFLLRLVPLGLRLAERGARSSPFGLRLAFLTAARNPAQAASATTFLAVALGVALFSLDYQATLTQHARDEGAFRAGARWRVLEKGAGDRSEMPDVTPLTRFASLSAERPTPVLRLQGGLRDPFASQGEVELEVLGLPAARIPQLLGWRENFASLDRADLAARLRRRPVRLTGPQIAHDARSSPSSICSGPASSGSQRSSWEQSPIDGGFSESGSRPRPEEPSSSGSSSCPPSSPSTRASIPSGSSSSGAPNSKLGRAGLRLDRWTGGRPGRRQNPASPLRAPSRSSSSRTLPSAAASTST